MNHEVKTTAQLRSGYKLLNYQPKNNPSETTGSIGVGYDSSGFSVSASVDYSHSELDVISNSNIGTNYYEIIYKFNNIWRYPFASGYIKGDVFSYGMLTFQYSGTVWFDVTHRILYDDIAQVSGGQKNEVIFSTTY